MVRKGKAVERDISDYSELKNRKKYTNLRGKTKEETIQALQARERQKEDALIQNINQSNPSGKSLNQKTSTKEIKDNFDEFIWRKAA